MKRLNSIIIALIFCLGGFSSCLDLNIQPTKILTDEAIFTENGIRAYMAGIYRNLPMEDFHYNGSGNNANGGYFQTLMLRPVSTMTGELSTDDAGFGNRHTTGYWGEAFKMIRQANYLIRELPGRTELENFSGPWIAEAKFIRAYLYFQLAKRYGGLPLVSAPQDFDPDDVSPLYIARSSHEETYDFILNDLDDAIADLPETSDAGRANKYVAAGLKSRAALTAATTSVYGHDKFADWEVDGVLLQGIPASRANGYFKQAWDAAKLIEGHYSLTPNYADTWENALANGESIWVRQYDYVNPRHSKDAVQSPIRMTTTYGARYGIPLDWVELFDYLPLDEVGHFDTFDENGYYRVYDSCHQLWDAMEPRLRAQILIPGMTFRGHTVDLRSGTFNPNVNPDTDKFRKFSVDDGRTNFRYKENDNDSRIEQKGLFNDNGDYFSRNATIITQNDNNNDQKNPLDWGGMKIFIQGMDGPGMRGQGGNGNTRTGIIGRKHLDMNMPLAQVRLEESTTPWVEMRYAEILLNRAEAALELHQRGETSYNGVNMQQDAMECINLVRQRGGAILLTSPGELSSEPANTTWDKSGPKGPGAYVWAPNRGLQILRVERYRELAQESKLYWDLLRWFSFDEQRRDTNTRALYSFMFASTVTSIDADGAPNGKYIYDTKQAEDYGEPQTFNRNDYYEGIPGDELQNNPMLQKNRNQ